MIAPGNHLDLDSLRAAPPARYRSAVRQIGICRAVRTCHSEPVRTTFVGISIDFRAAYRHTGRSILPFPGIHPREMVLSGRLPRQCALLYRNDREFDKFHFVVLLRKPEKHNILYLEKAQAGGRLCFCLEIHQEAPV